MTVEIHKPELEAFIMEGMKTGGFHNIEDALYGRPGSRAGDRCKGGDNG
jgi:hypothetical protein